MTVVRRRVKPEPPTEPWVVIHRDAPDTEREAAAAAENNYPAVAMQVLQYLVRVGGDYDQHGAVETNLILNSYAPARNALMRNRYVEDSGERARNERGRKCIIWVPTALGEAMARRGYFT